MKDFIKTLDENLEYLGQETDGDIVRIRVASARKAVACPYCGALSENVHSRPVAKPQKYSQRQSPCMMRLNVI